MSIKIEKVSYNNSKDRQVLKTILSKWFENPKELNWTDPRLNYPFNFNRWVELTYKDNNVKSFPAFFSETFGNFRPFYDLLF